MLPALRALLLAKQCPQCCGSETVRTHDASDSRELSVVISFHVLPKSLAWLDVGGTAQASQLPSGLRRLVPADFPPTQLVDAAFMAQHPDIFSKVRRFALLVLAAVPRGDLFTILVHRPEALTGSALWRQLGSTIQ